jgi:mono/diheme cytochrome c family protein/glucose/arabinose dehydrogenase
MRLYSKNSKTLFIVFLSTFQVVCFAQMGDNEGELQDDLPSHIMHMESPVLSPSQALESFVVQDGFYVELVASEPMIQDPVSAVFAPDGSLWVVEMQSFMPDVDGNNELEPISRIVHLTDTNSDGIMDESSVFMDGLVLPRSMALTHEGILLIAPPNLLYCRDIDGDGKCDDVQTLTGGLSGLDSVEHAGNGLMYGLDNLFHNSQHEYSFTFDGETLTSILVPPHGQWGTTQDDYGRQYYTPNSYPVLIDDLPKQYARQRGQSRTIDGLYRGITADKRVWPVHPTPGINRGYQEGRLDDNYKLTKFDAACGPAVYRDTLYGEDFDGDVFVCETVGNLVSRFHIEDNGNGSLRAVPAYERAEFLASTDERFRPVNLLNGPDGALYIVDMYRGIAQHRMFVTSFLRKQILARGLESPLGLGRIWRVVPTKTALRETPDLSSMPPEELVVALTNTNGTIRDIAQRLLVELADDSVVPLLEDIAKNGTRDRDRIKALWTLQGMGFLQKELVVSALKDKQPMVRTNAIRLAEAWIDEDKVFEKITTLQGDENFYVRRQVALSASKRYGPKAIFFLLEQLGKSENNKYRSAALASLMGREKEALDLIAISSILATDTQLNRETLSAIVHQLLLEKRESINTLLLDFAARQTRQLGWQSEVVLSAILAKQKQSQLRLIRQPVRYHSLFTENNASLHDAALALNGLLWWEGRSDVLECIPKRVDKTVANLINRGKKIYNVCKTCHQVDGLGLPPTHPPLVDSPFVLDDKGKLIKIMLHGLSGPITIDGKHYDESMPPAPIRNDYDIAAVMTYIRQAWGNDAGAISPQEVHSMREKYKGRRSMWTAEELID